MPLSDALAAAPTKRALNHSCSVALVLATISENDGPAEAEKVAAILRDPARVATNLAAVLRANGTTSRDRPSNAIDAGSVHAK